MVRFENSLFLQSYIIVTCIADLPKFPTFSINYFMIWLVCMLVNVINQLYHGSALHIYVIMHSLMLVHAGLGGSVGCAVQLETRRSWIQPSPRTVTFFRGD